MEHFSKRRSRFLLFTRNQLLQIHNILRRMIYFDEAGNTGDHLLDPNQPAFTLLSHDFSLTETLDILNPLLNNVKAKELHFSKLRKRRSYHKFFESIFNHDLIVNDRIYYYTADKFFITTIHLIDRLLESLMYKNGYDLYQNGENITSANMLHFLGTQVCDPNEYRKACLLFLKWVKEKTGVTANKFYDQLQKAAETCPHEMRDLFNMILCTRQYYNEITAGFSEKYTLDPTLSMFKDSCVHWSKVHQEIDQIYVDTSKPLDFFEEMLEFMKNVDDVIVGYGKNQYSSKIKFGKIIPVSSEEHLPIQLADILVSGVNHHIKCIIQGENDELSEMISKSKLFNINSRNAMWPTTNVTPESINMDGANNGINPLDFFVEQAIKHKYRSK